jgi:K+-sensing histidine kinase KdpD
MLIKNAQAWAPQSLSSYGYALVGVGIAFFLRYQFHPILQSSFPIIFFIFNTILISFRFGQGPAIFTVLLSIPLAYYFFIPPYRSFDLETPMDAFTIFIYLILFGVIIWLIEKLQRERYRAVLIARVCESRMEIMAKLSSKKRAGG